MPELVNITPRLGANRLRLAVSRQDAARIRRGAEWEAEVYDHTTRRAYRLRSAPCGLDSCHCDAVVVGTAPARRLDQLPLGARFRYLGQGTTMVLLSRCGEGIAADWKGIDGPLLTQGIYPAFGVGVVREEVYVVVLDR